MLETNVRLVPPGPDLCLWVRRAAVTGPDLSRDLLQRACGTLRYRHGLAAIPCDGTQPGLLVATHAPILGIHLEQENWVLEVSDAGGASRCLSLTDPVGASLIPSLIERSLLAELAGRTDLWTLDGPRIWYEAKAFRSQDGIAVYRRFEVAALLIEGVGVGVAVDVGTAFFTTDTLGYFFSPGDLQERQRRRSLFAELTGRQKGQKGTLLYDNGRSKMKCYFEDAPEGVTCASTGKLRVKNRTYDSVFAYYQAEYPELPVTEDTSAVRVSFPGIGRPQWVAADRVCVRVMNEDVPESLSAVDKIAPNDRRVFLEGFWNRLGSNPLEGIVEGFHDGFWRPEPSRITRLTPPALEFGQDKWLPPPAAATIVAYKDHYRRRLKYLDEAGCFSLPPSIGRTLYCAYPRGVGEEITHTLSADIVSRISKWGRRPFDASPIPYDHIGEAIEQLRRVERPGTVLFVLDRSPAAYYEVSFQLHDWRVKRVTEAVLREYHHYLKVGAWDKKQRAVSAERGQSRWDQFVTINALDVFQQMDGIPWRSVQAGPYEALLVIDVGHDHRHFALSLLIARSIDKNPSFGIYSVAEAKPDHKQEMMNPVMLADYMVRVFEKTSRRRFDPIGSLVVFRDGQVCGREPEGIEQGMAKLIAMGMLAKNARMDVVSFHKESLKSIRLWEVESSGNVLNPLEGTALRISEQMAVVASTGAATLHQGTAEPFMLVGDGRCATILDAATAAFGAAQLNWSSPGVAQRLPLPFKRTDEELSARAAQEIRRIR